jgi:soluble calcium-activated nucleotidase 1
MRFFVFFGSVLQHNEAGRGAELSELVLFKNKLLTFDDRTGIMFELQNYHNSAPTNLKGKAPTLVPRQLFMEGDGSTDKGMKVEWATVKDGLLWVGSFGKEYTSADGSILNNNNLWVKVMSERGVIQHVNWEDHYNTLRRHLGYDFPSYILHEAITWSPHHRKWFILPRRVSKDAYDEAVDEKKGSNLIITCNADFSDIQTTQVGVSWLLKAVTINVSRVKCYPKNESCCSFYPVLLCFFLQRITPVRGFSTFKFLPGSKDSVIIAIKSEENSALDRQTAYVTLYGIDEEATAKAAAEGKNDDNHNNAALRWKVLMEETEIPGEAKFEGLEVIEPLA